MTQATFVAKAVSKKSMIVKVDTGANEARLAEVGFDREFQRGKHERIVTLDIRNFRASGRDEAGYGNWTDLRVEGSIISFGALESLDKKFALIFLATQRTIHFVVVNGNKTWSFAIDGSGNDARDVIRSMFNNALVRGQRVYEKNAAIIPGFWEYVLCAVYQEPTIIEIGLYNKESQYVPSRVYFDPARLSDMTISAGGLCYNFDLALFPGDAIRKGLGSWTAEQRKRQTSSGVVSIGSLLVKKGNKDKPKRPAPVDIASLGLKSLSEQLVVHERTDAEKAGDAKRAAAVAAKNAPAKPAAAAAPAKKKAKA